MSDKGKRGTLYDDETARAVDAILRRGNNAEVRRRGGGVVVLEVERKIIYASGGSAPGKSNGS